MRVRRRGACPTLARADADGRRVAGAVRAGGGLTAAQAAGLAAAAGRLGNGRIEVTGRGSLQVRGLTPETAGELGRVVDGLGIAVRDGLAVMTGALAGLDPAEVEDPRPVAEAIRRGAAGLRLGPKVSVVVDGGGVLHLDGVAADVRVQGGGRRGLGGRSGVGRLRRGRGGGGGAAGALAARGPGARGRDGGGAGGRGSRAGGAGRAVGRALGIGLAFGQMEAAALAGLAAAVGDGELRPAAGRGLIAVGAAEGGRARGGGGAGVRGGSRAIRGWRSWPARGRRPARRRSWRRGRWRRRSRRGGRSCSAGVRLHLSGCGKRCAQPAGAACRWWRGRDGGRGGGAGGSGGGGAASGRCGPLYLSRGGAA